MNKGKLKHSDNNRIIYYFLSAFVIVMILCVVTCLVDDKTGLTQKIFGDYENGRNIAIEFFLVEVQVAFITLSLSTALSSSSKRVYWVETYTYRLISPRVTNFTALSAYILAVLLAGLIWCFIGFFSDISCVAAIFLSFILSVVFLILLSVRMIDANFGKERIKRELEEGLIKRTDALPVPQHIGMDKGRMLPEIHKLMQITIQEIDEKEFNLVSENLLLLVKMGFMIEFKEVYKYADSVIDSDVVMHELNYLIMKQVIAENRIRFFFSGCPIPYESLFDLWELVIQDVFDEAKSAWRAGNKEVALDKRKNLYITLTLFLSDRWEGIGAEASQFEYDVEAGRDYVKEMSQEELDETLTDIKLREDKETAKIINLMGLFVSKRQNNWFGLSDDDLDKDWEQSERRIIDKNIFIQDDSDNILDDLVEGVTRVLDTWDKGKWDRCLDYPEQAYMNEKARDY